MNVLVKFILGLLTGIGMIALIAVLSVIGGTIVFYLWPYVIPVVFPKLVADGVLAGKLSWLVSVGLTWLSALLLKSSSSNSK